MEREMDNLGKVVAMAGFDKSSGNRVTNEVRAYWEALRNGRDVPMRSDIDPRGIENALEYAFIVERIAPGMARFRLAGMHLNDLMGMEVRGMPLTAMFSPVGRKRVAEALEACFNGPNVVEMTLEAEAGVGKPPMTAKLILLPLKSDLGDVNRAIGCLVSEGPIGRTPRRFELRTVSLSPVVAGATVQRGLPEPVAPVIAGFSETPAGFRPTPRKSGLTTVGAIPGGMTLQAAQQRVTQGLTPEERRAMMRVVRSDD